MFIDKLIILHVKMIVNKNLSINIKFYTGYEKNAAYKPAYGTFWRRIEIRDANVKYLDAFTVALTQERWYFMNEYSFSQKGGRYAQDRRAVQTDA